MSKINLNHKRLALVKNQDDNIALYEYTPTLFSPLFYDFERMNLSRRIRYILEFFGRGRFRVYYLAVNDELIGHCVVAPGGRRLKCSTVEDIVLGPYFVAPQYRGRGFSKTLIALTLANCTYEYKMAYDYIAKHNIPSMKASISCGFVPCGEVNIVGKLHRIKEASKNGTYIVYRFLPDH